MAWVLGCSTKIGSVFAFVPVGQAAWSNLLPILGSTSGEAEPPLEAFSFTTCQQKEPQGLA